MDAAVALERLTEIRYMVPCVSESRKATDTLAYYGMKDGEKIDMFMILNQAGDIGEFNRVSGPGGRLLVAQNPSGGRAQLQPQPGHQTATTAITTIVEEVSGLVVELGGDPNARHQWLPPELQLLRTADCNVLINAVEAAHTKARADATSLGRFQQVVADFKIEISRIELEGLVGRSTVARLARFFEDKGHVMPPRRPGQALSFNQVKLRRTQPAKQPGVCIDFHTDFSERTMQLPLNGPCLHYSFNDLHTSAHTTKASL
eukprot:COSAG02_NODE_11600_length_1691_cov_1.873116_2_plen_260_part_00